MKKRLRDLDVNAFDKYVEWEEERYEKRENKNNIYGMGMTDQEFRHWVIELILGENWYVVDPLSQSQINEIALEEIIETACKMDINELVKKKKNA